MQYKGYEYSVREDAPRWLLTVSHQSSGIAVFMPLESIIDKNEIEKSVDFAIEKLESHLEKSKQGAEYWIV